MTELAVLVPVLNRPQNVAPLVESFMENCPNDSVLVALPSGSDDPAYIAWEFQRTAFVQDHAIIVGATVGTSWPAKINEGVTRVDADWYLCAADDIRFTEGWWDATKELRDDPTVGVIGTNDSADGTGNPRVASGDHTCHPLIRADYIREAGTIDARGKAVHDAYHHWYVDDELIWTAKSRGAWAFCREAVVEHLHPYWNKSEWDDTYTLGEAHSLADLELWRERCQLLGLTPA